VGISKYTKVFDTDIHYIESGEGDPILFLHGVPVSSYVWRNIIPSLSGQGRCIAPDLIGMGKSGKPDVEYTLADHIKYVDEFITKLDLHNITLVLHGLGSAIGFDYAMRNEDNVKGIAFYEAYLPDLTDKERSSLLMQHVHHYFKKDLDNAYKKIVEENYLLNNLLPANLFNTLDPAELETYHQPFAALEHRKPLWQYVKEFSLLDGYDNAVTKVAEYSEKLTKSMLPKLLLFAMPGFLTPMDTVNWCVKNLPNLEIADLDEGMHLAQESNPALFGQILKDWYNKIVAI
jgi:haloalkane dehalogenase